MDQDVSLHAATRILSESDHRMRGYFRLGDGI